MSSDEVRVLRPSRVWTVGLLIGGAFVTIMGFLFFADGWWPVGLWFFVIGGFIVLVQALVLEPNRVGLELSPDGFKWRIIFQSQSFRWSEVDTFSAKYFFLIRRVVFNFAPQYRGVKSPLWIATVINGRFENALPSGYEMGAKGLADLLNEYKKRYADTHRSVAFLLR
jgi:hypothetical protein